MKLYKILTSGVGVFFEGCSRLHGRFYLLDLLLVPREGNTSFPIDFGWKKSRL